MGLGVHAAVGVTVIFKSGLHDAAQGVGQLLGGLALVIRGLLVFRLESNRMDSVRRDGKIIHRGRSSRAEQHGIHHHDPEH